PGVKRDDDVLDDSEKVILGSPTSSDVNEINNLFYKNVLRQNVKEMILCYAKKNFSNKMMPAAYQKEFKQKAIENVIIEDVYSYLEASLQFANYLDKERKYLYRPAVLKLYKDQLDDVKQNYRTYFPQFSGEQRFRGFDKFSSLSYSQVKTFYECSYKYYLNKVLKLDELEESFSMTFGSLAHDILENIDKEKSFEEQYVASYKKYESKFKDTEKIFLVRLKGELKKTYDFIVEHESQVMNGKFDREQEFRIPIDSNVTLVGRIDKIIYSGPNNDYVTIIDYKSGSETFKEDDIPIGYSMQLPTYAYIFENHEYFADKKLIGLAISPLLNKDSKTAYIGDLNEYRKNIKLSGVFLNDAEILRTLDPNFEHLKSVKLKKDGTFGADNKVRDEDSFHSYAEAAKRLYLLASDAIANNFFYINPKLKSNKTPCEYCPFKDICFRDLKMFIVYTNKEEEEEE
ncbi:MAG: PD-(D/E)XK nuclease family protein, partial [Bacilli bacterium]|nr:PD-(D/E)XK nuclease family protein [Bacilli bacterium]